MPSFTEENLFAQGFLKLVQAFSVAVSNYGGCDVYAEKIAKWNKQSVLNSFINIAEPMRCGFQVLNHGDLWLNNMMFKSDEENNPIDVSMIDYQGSFWGTPATDVLYFLISSVADDIKIEHFDDFIEFYHEKLTSALKEVKYDQHIPTLSELHIDFLDKGSFGKFLKITG